MIEKIEYKGHKILRLIDNDNQRNSVQFGVRKARLILSEIDTIRQFCMECAAENPPAEAQGAAIAGPTNTDDRPIVGA